MNEGTTRLAVTRVANSCVLLEIGRHRILTDPFFTERWHVRRGEPLGMTVGELPQLTAIVASHAYPNHWDLRGLRDYAYKADTPVYTSTRRMARQAQRLGYAHAAQLKWGDSADPAAGLRIEAASAGRTVGVPANAYVIDACGDTDNGLRVYFGGEIRDIAHVERYRRTHPAVDIALLPVNGLRPLLGPPIVMGPAQAVAATAALGAAVLVPVHDAQGDEIFSRVLRRHGTGADAEALARTNPAGPRVVCLPTGERRDAW